MTSFCCPSASSGSDTPCGDTKAITFSGYAGPLNVSGNRPGEGYIEVAKLRATAQSDANNVPASKRRGSTLARPRWPPPANRSVAGWRTRGDPKPTNLDVFKIRSLEILSLEAPKRYPSNSTSQLATNQILH